SLPRLLIKYRSRRKNREPGPRTSKLFHHLSQFPHSNITTRPNVEALAHSLGILQSQRYGFAVILYVVEVVRVPPPVVEGNRLARHTRGNESWDRSAGHIVGSKHVPAPQHDRWNLLVQVEALHKLLRHNFRVNHTG